MNGYLKYSSSTKGDVEVIEDIAKNVRQVKAPQLLADVVTIDDYKYEVRFYDQDNWGTKSGDLYVPQANGQFVTWVVENPNQSAADVNTLRITKKQGSGQCEAVWEYAYTPTSPSSWTLAAQNCSAATLRSETRSSVFGQIEGKSSRTDTHYVYENGQLVWQAEEVFVQYDWGYVLTSSTVGTGDSTMSLSRSYYTDPDEKGSYKKVKSWTNYDGTWGMKAYDSQGRTTTIVQSYKDESMPGTVDPSIGRATLYDYTVIPNDKGDDGSVKPDKPRTVTEEILSIPVDRP